MSNQTVDEHEALARQIAYELFCDVRTVRRYLRGEHVRGLKGQLIADAVRRLRPASAPSARP